MAQIFPIDFEEKLTMAQDDYILFSDSEDGNKIKKAQYKNLKGEKGDTGARINSASFSGDDIVFGETDGSSVTLANAVNTLAGPQGEEGPTGPTGNGISSITSSKVGKTTTVTITETSGTVDTFQVQDGEDGQGSGDVTGPASSTDGHLAIFDGTTGKLIKDGGAVPTVPTNVSAFNNDAGYLTSSTGVTSVNGQTGGAVTVETPNTKTFYLSSTSDLTTAQAAYDWYADGKNPIVVLSNTAYMIKYVDIEKLRFGPTSFNSNLISNSTTSVTQDILDINFSSGVVSSITTSNSGLTGNFLRTDYNYSSPYTPAYDGSPATKKYVDDSVSVVSGDSGTTYTIKVSNSDPTSGTASNIITLVP